MNHPVRVPLLGALLLLLAVALTASLVPAGLALDRRVTEELRRTAVEDLGRAPMILEDRTAARAEALSMHAMTVATTEGLSEAVAEGRLSEAVTLATQAAATYGEDPVIVTPDGISVVGPPVPPDAVEDLRQGQRPVVFVYEGGMPRTLALMPFGEPGDWRGAAGSSSPLDSSLATTLAALARSDVTILGADGALVASTLADDSALALSAAVRNGGGRPETEVVREVHVRDHAVWVAAGLLADAGTILFSRNVEQELAALPGVRRGALLAGLLTLVLALGVGSLFAVTLSRPVQGLAAAAGRVAEGDFHAPIPTSGVVELDRLGASFRSMRESLRERLEELAEANRALEDRQRRLHDLQAELIRQDRLSSSARMAAELAHEIRNPVANVRNCLEVVRRSLPQESDALRFADMGIDELLRMHELAEHLLDLNRPAEPGTGTCDPMAVAIQVATLAGVGETTVEVAVRGPTRPVRVSMPPDALKQILFNLVENAREAAGGSGVKVWVHEADEMVTVEVLDRGPGMDDHVLTRLFDPFFTTKDAVTGVGLGLFVAEGLARRYGGRMEAGNRTDGHGARFAVEVPRVVEGEKEGADLPLDAPSAVDRSDDPAAGARS